MRNLMHQTADLVHEVKIDFYTVSGPVSLAADLRTARGEDEHTVGKELQQRPHTDAVV